MTENGDLQDSVVKRGVFLTVRHIARVHRDLPGERVELQGLSEAGQPVAVDFSVPAALDFALTILAMVRRTRDRGDGRVAEDGAGNAHVWDCAHPRPADMERKG